MIYLDNAATSVKKPQAVVDAVINALSNMGNAGRGVNDASLDAARTIFDTRRKLASFFNAKSPTEVVFTCNATESLNIALRGLLKPGDGAVTTVMEHNSVLRPLYDLETKGVKVEFAAADKNGNVTIESIEKKINADTKLIVCNHASNLSGNLIDIEAVGRLAKEKGLLFVVDASQSAGVFPIDVQKMNIDVLCFTGHKSLLGPQGTGGMIVKSGVEITPFKAGGTGVQTYNKFQPEEMPTRLEAGTLNGHGIAGLNAGVEYIIETGMDAIRATECNLARSFYEGICELPGVVTYGDYTAKNRAPIVTLNVGEYDSATVGDILFNEYDISIRSGGHCAPLAHHHFGTVETGAVRFSFSHNNTMDDVKTAINAVREIATE